MLVYMFLLLPDPHDLCIFVLILRLYSLLSCLRSLLVSGFTIGNFQRLPRYGKSLVLNPTPLELVLEVNAIA